VQGLQDTLYLGNLNAQRDWGHAKDYVEAMWLILQQEKPEDFVIATGVTTTVRDFAKMAFAEAGITIEFKGEGKEEKGIITSCTNKKYQLPIGKEVVAIDPNYFRPTEVDLLIGDATKAKEKLGWKPKHTLREMIKEMVKSDLETYKMSLERKYFM
jgi:GDPmannose 4,6-dehydratase